MRGRTNITQRSGLTVIGDVVTQKMVIGEKIEVGNFIEFTGQSTQLENVLNSNFDIVKSFKIDEYVSGFICYWNGTLDLRVIIFNKNEILTDKKIVLENSIGFTGDEYVNISFDNGKIYISEFETYRVTKDIRYLTVISVSDNYEVNYLYQKDLSCFDAITSTYKKRNYVFVKNSIIYCIASGSSRSDFASYNTYLLKYILDEEDNPIRDKDKAISLNYIFAGSKIEENDNKIYLVSGKNIMVINEEDFSIYSEKTFDSYYSFSMGFDFCFLSDLLIIFGSTAYPTASSTADPRGMQIVLFSISGNNIEYLTSYFSKVNTDNSNGYIFGSFKNVKEMDGNVYFVCDLMLEGNKENSYHYLYYLVIDKINYNINLINSASVDDGSNLGGSAAIFSTEKECSLYRASPSSSNSSILKINFMVDEILSLVENFDLVKKYERVINGVAKSSGNQGEIIDIYIPN